MADIESEKFIQTCHETVLYITKNGELRHGRLNSFRPRNIHLSQAGGTLCLSHIQGVGRRPILLSRGGCWSGDGQAGLGSGEVFHSLDIVPLARGQFGLKKDGAFLTAKPDGTIQLAASALMACEIFRILAAPIKSRPRIAAVTMVFNEPYFLPIWENYYSRQFGIDNLYLVDHGSNDGSTHSSKIKNIIRLPRDELDEDRRVSFISGLQESLLNYYDAVLFSDADEIIVADPDIYADLVEYCEAGLDRFSTCLGLEVLHDLRREGPLDLGTPILEQRKFVRFSESYCKPLIAEIPMKWLPGFHACQYAPRLDPNLYLFHLKCMDLSMAMENLKKTRNINWSQNGLSKGHGAQYRMADAEFIATFYPPQQAYDHASDKFDLSGHISEFNTTKPNLYQTRFGPPLVIPGRFAGLIPSHARMSGSGSEHLRKPDHS